MSTDAEIAWAAGLFEGEGCISLQQRGKPALTLGMCDEDAVRRFHTIIGVGQVYGPYNDKNHPDWSPKWVWKAVNRKDVPQVYMMLRPWLCQRRGQRFDQVMATYGSDPNRWTVVGHWRTRNNVSVWVEPHERSLR
jgi:hypothetical protein